MCTSPTALRAEDDNGHCEPSRSRAVMMMLRKSILLNFSRCSTSHNSDGTHEAHGWSKVCVAHAADEEHNDVLANRAHHEVRRMNYAALPSSSSARPGLVDCMRLGL